MSSLAFVIVQKYCDKVPKLRLISRIHEGIYRKIWKQLYGYVTVRKLEALNYVRGCNHINLELNIDYGHMGNDVIISQKYVTMMNKSGIYGNIGVGRVMQKKHLKSRVKEYLRIMKSDNDLHLDKRVDDIIAELKREKENTIRCCLESLEETKKITFNLYHNNYFRLSRGWWNRYLDGSKEIAFDRFCWEKDDFQYLSRVKILKIYERSHYMMIDYYVSELKALEIFSLPAYTSIGVYSFLKLENLKVINILYSFNPNNNSYRQCITEENEKKLKEKGISILKTSYQYYPYSNYRQL